MNLPINKQLLRFLIISAILYIAWQSFYWLWLHPYKKFELFLGDNITDVSSFILATLGFELIPSTLLGEYVRTLGIDGTHGVWIGNSCVGLQLLALFAGFIIAYPGPVKKKLLFIPFGLVTIYLINILRIVGLCIITLYAPEMLDFNHHYTFTITVYAYIFLLWIIWVNRYSKTPSAIHND